MIDSYFKIVFNVVRRLCDWLRTS